MQTRLLMICSSAFTLSLGLLATIAPQELMAYVGSNPKPLLLLTIRATGALYLGFSVLNWMAKDSLIGGIYSRPVAMGNLLHFFPVAITLLKALAEGHREPVVLIAACLYVIFAAWFGLVVFRSPVRNLQSR